MLVDGSSNLKGGNVKVVLEGVYDILIEQSLQFDFKANNNQVEYETLIAGMKLAKKNGSEGTKGKE
jgi:ribonuclease HI